MLRFALARLAAAAATLLGSATLVFFLTALAPGDPARLASGVRAGSPSRESIAALRRELGLDRPILVRYGDWLRRAAVLDLGRSFGDGRPVRARIAETLPATLALNLAALALAAAAALPLGVGAALRPGGRLDRLSGAAADLLFSVPPFVLGLGLLVVFAGKLRLVPVFSDPSSGLPGVVLPVATLALSAVAPISRFVRRVTADALAAPPTLAARSRGEGTAAIVERALRRSAGPLAALAAALVPVAVTGSVLVERVFSFPGSGALLADAVFARDYPVVLGLAIVSAAAVSLASLAADLVAAALDPRVADAADGEAT